MTDTQRIKRLINAVKKGSLAIIGGKRKWHCYELDTHILIWERNCIDGAEINVYYKDRFLETIIVDNNLDKVYIEN